METDSGSRTAIGLIARAPSAPGKSRLAAHLPDARLRSLREALLADSIEVILALAGIDRFLFFTPDDADAEIAAMAGASFSRQPQRGDTLGQRMRSAFEALLADRRYASAILVGSDIPLMTTAHIDGARRLLRDAGDVVLGPADDGGYYLIGMRRLEARVFDGIEWGSARVLEQTLLAARDTGLRPQFAERAYDVDTIEDLHRLQRDLKTASSERAPNVRAWLAALSP